MRGEWDLRIHEHANEPELVHLTGLPEMDDAVAVAVALAKAGYASIISTSGDAEVSMLLQLVPDGMVMVAGRRGKDLSQWDHPSWVREFRRKVRQVTGEHT